jgi:hypothetical protein
VVSADCRNCTAPLLPTHSSAELEKQHLPVMPHALHSGADSKVSATQSRSTRGRGRFHSWPGAGRRSPSGRVLDVLEEVDEKVEEEV